MKRQRSGSSLLLWIGVPCSIAIAGYCFIRFFYPKIRLGNNALLKKEVEDANGILTPDLATRIMLETNRIADEMYKNNYPGLDDKRRSVLNNDDEYQKISLEVFAHKEESYSDAITTVLTTLENKVALEEIVNVFGKLKPSQIEQLAYKYEPPSFEIPYPDQKIVKEAYLYYGSYLKNGIKNVQTFLTADSDNAIDKANDQKLLMNLLLLKARADDSLYLKYNLTEYQIRFLLYEKNLMSDPEIKTLHSHITSYDEMFADRN